MATKKSAKKRSSGAPTQKSDGSRAQAAKSDPGQAYGEEVRYGLETGTRADNVLPERNVPSRDTQTVTPIATGPSQQGGGPYNE